MWLFDRAHAALQPEITITEVYRRQTTELKELYLERLLLRDFSDEYDLSEFIKLHNNNDENDWYAVTMMVSANGYSSPASETANKNAANVSKSILERTFSHLIPEYENVYVIIKESRLICVHNFGVNPDMEEKQRLNNVIEMTLNILNSLQDTKYTAFISNIYKSAYKLKDAYDEVLEQFSLKQRELTDESSEDKPDWIKSCIEIIEKNYFNTELSTSFIAEELGLTRSYLSSGFMKHMEIGLHEYIQNYRISKAKYILMDNPGIRIANLANKCGFITVTSFIRAFKKVEGITPGTYREQLKGERKDEIWSQC